MVNLHLFAAQIWPVPCQAVAVQDEGAITVKEEHRPAALGGLGYPFVKSPQTRDDDPLLPNPKILFLWKNLLSFLFFSFPLPFFPSSSVSLIFIFLFCVSSLPFLFLSSSFALLSLFLSSSFPLRFLAQICSSIFIKIQQCVAIGPPKRNTLSWELSEEFEFWQQLV